MNDNDSMTLLKLIEQYAREYGDDAPRGMTVEQLCDDLAQSVPYSPAVVWMFETIAEKLG
ncbi:MAG: hypothetical protein KGL35_06485 [Bradyrhizobium sp.]|nr:hypothetical protein [Bradyrhizobium sp.]